MYEYEADTVILNKICSTRTAGYYGMLASYLYAYGTYMQLSICSVVMYPCMGLALCAAAAAAVHGAVPRTQIHD